jgi:hypothetical protein
VLGKRRGRYPRHLEPELAGREHQRFVEDAPGHKLLDPAGHVEEDDSGKLRCGIPSGVSSRPEAMHQVRLPGMPSATMRCWNCSSFFASGAGWLSYGIMRVVSSAVSAWPSPQLVVPFVISAAKNSVDVVLNAVSLVDQIQMCVTNGWLMPPAPPAPPGY